MRWDMFGRFSADLRRLLEGFREMLGGRKHFDNQHETSKNLFPTHFLLGGLYLHEAPVTLQTHREPIGIFV